MNEPLIKVVDLHKSYPMGEGVLEVIKGIDLEVYEGESISLLGPSGAGKSTLLCLLAGMEKPSRGKVYWKGEDILKISDIERANLRKKSMGFVFQFFNLLPELSALENIMLPGLIDNKSVSTVKERAKKILKKLKLTARASHYPHALSGGEQQRVAIGRALMNNPVILFADEPTGNVDRATEKKILKLLLSLARERGKTIFIATHQESIASSMSHVVRIIDGRVEEDKKNDTKRKCVVGRQKR
jgi:predicted ABC-type transport system involved in lysophospholipase L1 biosynthesis ATPase subunit